MGFNKLAPSKEDTVDAQDRQPEVKQEAKATPVVVDPKCPDCNGDGIKSPTDTFVCRTCDGTGKA